MGEGRPKARVRAKEWVRVRAMEWVREKGLK
jgi:hypothetical protein